MEVGCYLGIEILKEIRIFHPSKSIEAFAEISVTFNPQSSKFLRVVDPCLCRQHIECGVIKVEIECVSVLEVGESVVESSPAEYIEDVAYREGEKEEVGDGEPKIILFFRFIMCGCLLGVIASTDTLLGV
jgi:hypothetical protein